MTRPFQPMPTDASAAPRNGGTQAAIADGPGPRLALLSIIGFWAFYFLIVTTRAAVSDMPAQGEMLIRRTVVTFVAMGLTWLLYLLLQRFREVRTGRLLAIAFAASLPLAVAYSTVNYIAFEGFPIAELSRMDDGCGPGRATPGPVKMIVSTALEWYFFIATWAIVWVALSYSAKVRSAERRAASYARMAQDAELRALRYQVNPHFLFNTLNSLSSLVLRSRSDEAEQMILNLSTFFRASLTREATENVPLAEEVRLQLLYLDIEKVRFPDRLIVKISVPDSLSNALVPVLILQPLVENAIKYGVSRSQEPVTVTIAAHSLGDRLELSVEDDGRQGTTEEEAGCGVGIANVAARLQASYGDAAGCIAGPRSAGGWMVRLSLPLIRA